MDGKSSTVSRKSMHKRLPPTHLIAMAWLISRSPFAISSRDIAHAAHAQVITYNNLLIYVGCCAGQILTRNSRLHGYSVYHLKRTGNCFVHLWANSCSFEPHLHRRDFNILGLLSQALAICMFCYEPLPMLLKFRNSGIHPLGGRHWL